ncbi:MAG: PEP-utilizing enzyme [Planctomycetota bacterium]|nr:PEP-utilizing enzyme [Planctomycetota bacterium]
MTYTRVYTQSLGECRDISLAGGKAANLGRLIRAGFPVPDGFVITTRAYRLAQEQAAVGSVPAELPAVVAEEVRLAYHAMAGGPVAIRSSATAEDTATASMAGQYETFLNIVGEASLLDAVWRCWVSLHTPRTRAYLHEQGIDPSGVAMAVLVQRLVSAEVAGVLFTTNPHPNGHREMLVEASWGLGEAVVSGQVQPDTLRLDQETGRVLAASIADKHMQVTAGSREDPLVEELRRRQPCLCGRDVHRLWHLGKRVAAHFGAPQDIEWAIHAGKLFVLQARPITTLQDAEAYEDVLRSTRQQLRQALAAGRGPWVLHNLAESLPHPTPLTWSILRRFMSGSGGFGAMYRQAGFAPSPTVNREGFLDCLAGRIYMDVSRAPDMFFENFPFAYDLVELQRSPDASQTPPTLPRGSLASRLKAGRRLAAATAKLQALAADFDRQLRDRFFPSLARYVADAKQLDLRSLSAEQLVDCWQTHEQQVLDTFGPQSLLPSLISEMALAELRVFLAEQFWDEEPDSLALLISSGGPPDRTVSSDLELYEVGQGQRPLATWLAEHGHRASGEFDLAAPRWREQPEAVHAMAARLAVGDSPQERYRRHAEAVERRIQLLRERLSGRDRREFERCVELVRRYVAFREDAKDFLMLGYDLLRDLALEAGRRLDVGQDVFCLTRDDLFDAIRVGFAPFHLIEQRKLAYRTEARLKLPRVIDQPTLDALGAMPDREPTADGHQAFAVSSGEASGPARILAAPADAGDLGRGYILVCPSTDPSWTPLFVNAAGLVLERGGSLSHGAVVAREMGLPAVVLPEATQLFREGELLRVDGDRGWVGSSSEAGRQTVASAAIDPDDVRVPQELIPPPPGPKDRRAARLRNVLAIVWAAYLLAVFLLPECWAYQPTLSALDFLFWPMVRSWGKPATVAMIAAGLAALTLIVQKLVTDNRRLREAKHRAAALQKQAHALPQDSRRRAALLRLATPVQLRTLLAALVPIAVLLGPMLLPFLWFKQRIDPAVWNVTAGSAVQVVALVESDWREPIRIEVPPPVAVDDATPRERTLSPLRQTLERLLALYRQPRSDPAAPWELQAAPDLAREQTANDLQAYLAAGLPPQGITWLVRPPEDRSGQFPVAVTTPGHPPVTVCVVLGEEYPPVPRITKVAGDSPIQELRVVYPKPRLEPVFWRPLARVLGDHPGPLAARLAAIDVGWLWLYILAYLPTLLLVRRILKVA